MKNTKRNKLWLLAIPALLVILAIVVTACNGSREEPAEPQINTTAAPTEQTQPVTETTEAVEETTEATEETTEATEETTEATEETTEPTEETTAPTTGSNSGNSGDSDDSGTNPTVPKLEVPDPGTQKNPYVEVVSAYPGEVTTVNIPKKGTVSYMLWGVAGKVITIEDPDVKLVVGENECAITVPGLTIGQLIGKAEEFCQSYMAAHGGRIDYIHNDDTAIAMGQRPGCAAVLLPRMEKGELFPSIVSSGPFPKKSFSIGHAEDKRYYLECRKIK